MRPQRGDMGDAAMVLCTLIADLSLTIRFIGENASPGVTRVTRVTATDGWNRTRGRAMSRPPNIACASDRRCATTRSRSSRRRWGQARPASTRTKEPQHEQA